MANEVAQRQQSGITTFLNNTAVRQNIESVVGKKATPTFISSVVSAVQANPMLKDCTNNSILSAALLGESLKLTPSPQLGQYYLVPYNDKKQGVSQATFQLGWKGYVQLAIRSGQYRKIGVSEIKDGEVKNYNPITEDIEFEPITDVKARAKAQTIGYYAYFELLNGFRKELYWSKEQMEQHARHYSKSYASDLRYGNKKSFWSINFDQMACKTLLRQLISKYGIMSVDMQKAYDGDMAVIGEDGSAEYVDNDVASAEADTQIAENANSQEFTVESEVVENKEDG